MAKAFDLYKKNKSRITLFYLLYGIAFLWLLLGLAWRQVIKGKAYAKLEQHQCLRRIIQPATRGCILDRNSKVLVDNKPYFSAILYLGELRGEFRQEYLQRVRLYRELGFEIKRHEIRVETRAAVVQRYLDQLNQILGSHYTLDEKKLEQHFRQRLLLPIPIVTNLKEQEYARLIEQLPIASPLQVYTDSIRYYPNGSLAAHVLGYVSLTDEMPEDLFDDNLTTFCFKSKVGKSGLEKFYDDRLQGNSGGEIWLVDPSGFQYSRLMAQTPKRGEDLVTSLDLDLQQSAEEAINDKTGAVTVLDVRTGEVLAMASKPDYDLNLLNPRIPEAIYQAIDARGGWINRCIQGLYPPGSTFKLISTIALLRNRIINENTQHLCIGYSTIGRRRFHCDNRNGHGVVFTKDAISKSCNPFFFEAALKSGPLPIIQEAQQFHLDKPTGIDLPFESRGMLIPTPPWKQQKMYEPWADGDTANLVIGQGFLLVTPLQMACVAASIARNETVTTPTLLKTDAALPPNQPIGLREADYRLLLESMEMAVQKGTARRSAVSGIKIAGKTGTSQVRVKGEPRHVVWYIGFAPMPNPEIAVSVLIEEKSGTENYGGGKTAAPIAQKVLQTYFNKTCEKPPIPSS